MDPKKCYWLNCSNPPREGSKYCSDNCGLKLATFRIMNILPEKVKALTEAPSVADIKDKQRLEKLNDQITEVKMLLDRLEGKRVALDEFISQVEKIAYQPEQETEGMKGRDDNPTMLTCVLCGTDVNVKNYILHVERCFDKIEKTVIPESKIPTLLPGIKILCEHFNRGAGTYCRRLDVLCPEHNRAKKGRNKRLGDSIICGSPETEELDVSKVCRAAKSTCGKHFNWENLRRADIDLQKWNAFVKLDDLTQNELQIQKAMKERRSLLGLLLHTTTVESSVSPIEGND